MSSEKYIGGAFAQDDSLAFSAKSDIFFQTDIPVIGFETGADALAFLVREELKIANRSVYFPLHYCEETIARVQLKVPQMEVLRYAEITELPLEESVVIWNHFNGYIPIPEALVQSMHCILEDCVQTLTSIHKRKGKASFTSLRKWLELDLALVFGTYSQDEIQGEHSPYYLAKKEAEALKREWKIGKLDNEKVYLEKFSQAEGSLLSSQIYFHSIEALTNYNWIELLNARQKNSKVLIDFLQDRNISPLSNAELFVMIQLENRDEIRRDLAQNGIFAPVHWLDSSNETLAKTLLSLPIDQRYNAADMQRIVRVLEKWL